MSDLSSSSFIPKRKSAGSERHTRRRNFFIFTIISYALFAAAPIASAAVYIYQIYTQKVFDQSVIALDAQIKNFSQADMSLVLDFNNRIENTNRLIQSHISILSLFDILESATANTVQFNDMKITRPNNSTLALEATLAAGSLDAVLFQRGEYSINQQIASTTFSQLTFKSASDTSSDSGSKQTVDQPFTFTADLIFDTDNILYIPDTVAPAVMVADPISSTTATTTTDGITPVINGTSI